MTAAPDIAGAVVAWRVWRAIVCDGAVRLASVVQPTVWEPRRALSAECHNPALLRWLRRRGRHTAPYASCHCGIYAAGLGLVGDYLLSRAFATGAEIGRVIGQVSLWGDVVECERGFRAASAYPLRLYVPRQRLHPRDVDPVQLARSLTDYGVPVALLAGTHDDALANLA